MRLKMKYIALAALVVSIVGLWWAIETTQASIDYWMDKEETFTRGLNSIKIRCKNGGEADGHFYLNVKFINASFSNQTGKPYSIVDDSTVKCKFGLHKGESNWKFIYFSVDENTRSFSIQLSLEKITFFLSSNPKYPTSLEYEWNEETENYCCTD